MHTSRTDSPADWGAALLRVSLGALCIKQFLLGDGALALSPSSPLGSLLGRATCGSLTLWHRKPQ